MKPLTISLFFAILLAPPVLSQELTHPTELGLPESRYERPDPARYAHELDNGLVAYVAEASRVPLVTMSAFVRAGLVSDAVQGSAEASRGA